MEPKDPTELVALLDELARHYDQRLFYRLYPERDTPQRNGEVFHARDRYLRHMEFFEAGARYRERAAICGNRVGKTLGMGGYETAAHLTGQYPAWWPGRRFPRPVEGWASGKTNESTRDTVQRVLLGPITGGGTANKGVKGTGVIPGACLGRPTWKQGVPDLVDTIPVKHVTGGWSMLGFKSAQQGRGAYEGTAKDFVWCDEEHPIAVYGEALVRTAITGGGDPDGGGIIYCTFTSKEGMNELVLHFMPQEMRPDA